MPGTVDAVELQARRRGGRVIISWLGSVARATWNALFYKTMNGARVGDLFMSLIHTCELNRINPFDYLTELLRHPAEVTVRPAEWMPWNYRRDPTAVAA